MEETGKKTAGSTLALLSNVNMDYVIRLLRKQAEVWQGEGYGNELGMLMNPASAYHAFGPDITFLVMDLMEFLEHDLNLEAAQARMDSWFGDVEAALRETELYYISDAYLWGPELTVLADAGRKAALENLWQEHLEKLCDKRKNVRIFPYRHLIERMGEESAFSIKMWYMGRILLGTEAQKRLCGLILEKAETELRVPKKVLLLDLDDTLWGGLAGEQEHRPVELSEEHGGLAYKDLQRVILQMQQQGVLLGIVSKNNEADALEILEKHPHMVLRPEVFAARRINWRPKHENIREIAAELNLGLDSFVFWDDSPQERQLVRELLPQVTVPDFPERKEELAACMGEIYRSYFARSAVTEEDRARTAQYAANSARRELEETAGSFGDYLRQLEITAVRVSPWKHLERLVQLMNKTNQFNLTTRRYTRGQMAELLEAKDRRIYLYSVADRFGDHGIVAAVVADCRGEVPVLTDFVMSCRVMGKNIEYALAEDIERDLRDSGYGRLRGVYIPTAKNVPVADLYERLGYTRIASGLTGEEWGMERTGAASAGTVSVPGACTGSGTTSEPDTAPGTTSKPDTAPETTSEPDTVPEPKTGQNAASGPAAEYSAASEEKTGTGSESRLYEISLEHTPERMYYVKMEEESVI